MPNLEDIPDAQVLLSAKVDEEAVRAKRAEEQEAELAAKAKAEAKARAQAEVALPDIFSAVGLVPRQAPPPRPSCGICIFFFYFFLCLCVRMGVC